MAAADRFFKNGWVRGNSDDPILIQHTFEFAGNKLRAIDIVVPDALSLRFELD
jgi:hypothetical protein